MKRILSVAASLLIAGCATSPRPAVYSDTWATWEIRPDGSMTMITRSMTPPRKAEGTWTPLSNGVVRVNAKVFVGQPAKANWEWRFHTNAVWYLWLDATQATCRPLPDETMAARIAARPFAAPQRQPSAAGKTYSVRGEVWLPGVYPWVQGTTAAKAIAEAGGITERALASGNCALLKPDGRQHAVIVRPGTTNDVPLEAGDTLFVAPNPAGPSPSPMLWK